MDNIKSIFLADAAEQLEALETSLLNLEQQPENLDSLHAAFRAAHTIKGSAGIANAGYIGTFTHDVENILDRMREGELLVNPELVSALLNCTDHIEKLLAGFSRNEEPDAPLTALGDALLAELRPWLLDTQDNPTAPLAGPLLASETLQAEDDSLGIAHDAWHVSLRLGREIFQRGVDPISLIRYLGHMGELVRVFTLTEQIPVGEAFNAEDCYLGFEIDVRGAFTHDELEEAFAFIQGECDLYITRPFATLNEFVRLAQAQDDGHAWLNLLAQLGCLQSDELNAILDLLDSAPHVDAASPLVATARQNTDMERHQKIGGNELSVSGVGSKATSSQLRVDADKLDRLVSLVGELVIAGEAASVLGGKVGREDLSEALSVLSQLIEDLRESAMQIRMVQIGATFSRFKRVVRDVSKELGKEIRLVTLGDDTELDKSVVEKISDPLMHLVRNSIDHGIESTEQRLAAGKPAEGCITLSAHHAGNSIEIQIQDDGGGLNTQKILNKAIEKKLIAPNQTLSETEIQQLIFEPGFSTADQVTALSGRGVGMDVVRRNIQALRGSLAVKSIPGQGTTITVRLPLTLAIIDGFRVGVGEDHYVIPLELVQECIAFEETQDNGCNYISLRGEMLPYVSLREMFNAPDVQEKVEQNVVVVRFGGQEIGLVVERLYGEMKAVIKPLSVLFSNVAGISGCSLLGGGEIAVILDIPALIKKAMHDHEGVVPEEKSLVVV